MAFIKGIQGCWLTWRSTCLASKQQTRKPNVWLDFSLALQQPWRTGLRRFISFHMHTSHWGSGNEKTRCSILADTLPSSRPPRGKFCVFHLCIILVHCFHYYFTYIALLNLYSCNCNIINLTKIIDKKKKKKKQPGCSKSLLGLVYEIKLGARDAQPWKGLGFNS